MDNRRLGFPKSDVERAATHFNVPVTEVSGEMVRHVGGIPRGSGLESEAEKNKELLLDVLEHEAVGSGRVIDVARAEATPCTCFTYDTNKEACWSSGILGLMTSEKNPEQIAKYCALGKTPDGSGVKQRFAKVKEAVEQAHKKWEKTGDGLPEWWEEISKSLKEHKIEL